MTRDEVASETINTTRLPAGIWAQLRGAAFGLRQSLDTVGAFIGPLVAVGLMIAWSNDFRAVFWVAVIPAMASVALLGVGVREPAREAGLKRANPLRRDNGRNRAGSGWPGCRSSWL